MSGGSNTDRGGMSEARKKQREKSKIKSIAAHLVCVGWSGVGAKETARRQRREQKHSRRFAVEERQRVMEANRKIERRRM